MEYNLASSTNFKAEIVGAPEFNYFIQNVSIPSISMQEAPTPYTNYAGFMPGETLEYDPLTFVFIISEDYANYRYLVQWFKDLQKLEKPKDHFKDIIIHVLNNNKLTNFRVVFYDCFPTMLGDIDLESAVVEPSTPVCQLTVRYQYFDILMD